MMVVEPTRSHTESIQLMHDKQELAFEHLTKLAVWVQEYVPACEDAEREVKARRDGARRALADLWLQCR